MPDIEKLDIINCNTIDTQETDRAIKCNTNTANCQGSRCDKHYTNVMQEAGRPQQYYTNWTTFQNLTTKISKQLLIMKYQNKLFLPDPSQDGDKKVSTDITEQLQCDFKDVFT